MTNQNDAYANAAESASVIRQATKFEAWLNAELTRIDPHRLEQGHSDYPAMVKLLERMWASLQGLSKCAQCKKEYRSGRKSNGCPKCAPGIQIPETEFQKPIAQPAQEPKLPEFFAELEYSTDWDVLVSVYQRQADAPPKLCHQEKMPKQLGAQPEQATEADELLRALGLNPDAYRTDGGAINHRKIQAALKYPQEYLAQPAQEPATQPAPTVPCECHRCIDEHSLTDDAGFPLSLTKMILCPKCGNKRCPKASDHRLECTGSNQPGQAGSVYGRPWEGGTP